VFFPFSSVLFCKFAGNCSSLHNLFYGLHCYCAVLLMKWISADINLYSCMARN
jgi:hypothetical protein